MPENVTVSGARFDLFYNKFYANIELAKKNNIPVVYTKWVRTNNTDDMIGDVVDGKRFWSF